MMFLGICLAEAAEVAAEAHSSCTEVADCCWTAAILLTPVPAFTTAGDAVLPTRTTPDLAWLSCHSLGTIRVSFWFLKAATEVVAAAAEVAATTHSFCTEMANSCCMAAILPLLVPAFLAGRDTPPTQTLDLAQLLYIPSLGRESHWHVGNMLPKQPNVSTFGQHAPCPGNTKLIPTHLFLVSDCQHSPIFFFKYQSYILRIPL